LFLNLVCESTEYENSLLQGELFVPSAVIDVIVGGSETGPALIDLAIGWICDKVARLLGLGLPSIVLASRVPSYLGIRITRPDDQVHEEQIWV